MMCRRVILLLLVILVLHTATGQPRRLCGARLWKAVQAICKSTARITDVELPVVSTRSIVDDCCKNTCTHSQILSYCADKHDY